MIKGVTPAYVTDHTLFCKLIFQLAHQSCTAVHLQLRSSFPESMKSLLTKWNPLHLRERELYSNIIQREHAVKGSYPYLDLLANISSISIYTYNYNNNPR